MQSAEQGAIRRACGVTQFRAAQGHGQVDDALHRAMPSTASGAVARVEASSKWCSDGEVRMTHLSNRKTSVAGDRPSGGVWILGVKVKQVNLDSMQEVNNQPDQPATDQHFDHATLEPKQGNGSRDGDQQ